MDPRKCPGCGSPLGSGTLAGLCPRCLFAGDPRAQVTEDDHSDAKKRAAAAAVGVLQADADSCASAHESGANDAAPLQDLVIGRRTDPIPRDEPDSFPPPHLAPVDPAVTWSDRAPAPRIEGYEVLREIKQGGQGVVYLAVQRSTKRKVAVKVLLAGMFASKPARRRFEREIELVASLKHPNIISVFDSGSTPEGHDYYVMDYVRGVPLTQHVREKGLGLEQVLAMFATTCEAVNHAHLRGVIHRDLKPSNILVDADGNVRVLDFGLAKALIEPAESIVSVTGNMVGTFPYMSPEQTRANPDEMDTRTDVYALGVVLYEALTGKHPYPVTGNVADIVRHIVETPPASPARTWTGESGVRPASGPGRRRKPGRCPIDGDLETILLKALSKERERRYDNAGHFARDIRRYLGNEPIVARRASAWYQLRMFSRRNRALVVASVGIFVGLILGVVTTTWFAVKLKAANTQLTAATEAIGNFMAFGGDERADNEDLLAASNLYLRALQEARGYGQSGSAILAGLVEIGTRPGGDIPLLGSYGGAYGSGVFRGHSAKPNNVAILHASRRALTSGDDGELILWDLDSGRRVAALTTGHGRIAYVAASPDGKWALTGGEDGTVRRWRVDPLAEVETLLTARAAKPDEEGNFKTEPVWMVAISHDGNRVLAGTSTGQIILRDADGMSRVVGECDGESAAALAFVPGDTRFALSGDGHGFIRLWDVDAGRQVWTKPHQQSGQVNSLVFSPDGESVATASHGNTLVVWQASGKGAGFRLTQRFKPIVGTSLLWRVAYAPDGKHVATAARGGGVTVYDAKSGALSRQFRAQRGDTMGLEFLDDNTLVSTGDATLNGRGEPLNSALMVWDLTERAGVTVSGGVKGMSVDDGGAVRVTNGAGGETLLYVGRDGALHSSIPSGGTSARPRWSDESDGSDRATDPNWAQGGRSGPRPASDHAGPPTPPVELFKLADGSVKLYGGADGTLQFWGTPKPPPGEAAGLPVPMRLFHGHQGQVTVVAVSPNGRYIVSADASGTVLAWDLYRPLAGRDLERKLRAANDQLNKNPSDPAALLALNDWFAFRGREVVRH